MMREDIRRARVEQYGSFLYCPKRDTICSCLDNELAICNRKPCLYEDNEWISEQEKISRNRAIAAPKPKEETPVIKATTQQAMTLMQKIKYEEELAARLYKANKPRAAQVALNRAMIMRGDLRK